MTKNQSLVVAAMLVLALVVANVPAHAQKYSDLYSFGTKSNDPIQAQPGNIVQGRDGNLYSATERGGTDDYGTVFKITPEGTLSVIYSFGSPGALYPTGGLTLSTDGNFYGTNQAGGTYGQGIVYKVTPAGNLTVLHNFESATVTLPTRRPQRARMETSMGQRCREVLTTMELCIR
jgi:uncharacterized repeat protein (TIGR03803 family)